MRRIQYRCRDCPETFTNAQDSNAHHDATGHNQTFRCPQCGIPLSAHSQREYEECAAFVPAISVLRSPTEGAE